MRLFVVLGLPCLNNRELALAIGTPVVLPVVPLLIKDLFKLQGAVVRNNDHLRVAANPAPYLALHDGPPLLRPKAEDGASRPPQQQNNNPGAIVKKFI
jgi:hypothetical protein